MQNAVLERRLGHQRGDVGSGGAFGAARYVEQQKGVPPPERLVRGAEQRVAKEGELVCAGGGEKQGAERAVGAGTQSARRRIGDVAQLGGG